MYSASAVNKSTVDLACCRTFKVRRHYDAFSWLAALFSQKMYTLTIHIILAWENECEFVSYGVCERQIREAAAGCSRPSCV